MVKTSIENFKAFKATVSKTNQWFAIGRKVDLSPYFRGKTSLTQKGFNFIKWMYRVTRLKKLVDKLKGIAKKLIKLPFKGLKSIAERIVKFIVDKTKGIFKFATKTLPNFLKDIYDKKLKPKIKNIIEKTKGFAKKVLNKVADLVKAAGKYVKKLLSPILNPVKHILGKFWGFLKDKAIQALGKIKNLTLFKKGKALFDTAKGAVSKAGGQMKRFFKGGIELFKSGTATVVTKLTGLGKGAKDLTLAGKDKVKYAGVEAMEKFAKAKKWFRVNKKLAGRWLKNSKVFKYGKAMLRWVGKIVKFFIKLGMILLKPISSTVAKVFAGVTFGLSFLFPLILGLIIEFLMAKSELFDPEAAWWKKILRWGGFIINVLSWVFPGGAGVLKDLAMLCATSMPGIMEWLISDWFEAQELKKLGINDYQKPANDLIFDKNAAEHIDNIKDMQKHILLQDVAIAKHQSDVCNFKIKKLIRLLADKQQERTKHIIDLNAVLTV